MSGASMAAGAAGSSRRSRFRFNERYIGPVLITCILIAGEANQHILESYLHTGVAILTSVLVELGLGLLYYRKPPNLASAYVSGISVGILVRSPYLWPFALCSALAINSKYVLRYRGRHLWNPSNFGIVALVLLAAPYVAVLNTQFGNSFWALVVVWTLGLLIISRLRRLHICITYVLSFAGYALLRSLLLHTPWKAEIAPITGPMYQLFTFFMITDPRTTVKSRRGQILVVFLVATVENLLRIAGSVYSAEPGTILAAVTTYAPFVALTLVGPAAMWLELRRSPRGPGQAGSGAREPRVPAAPVASASAAADPQS